MGETDSWKGRHLDRQTDRERIKREVLRNREVEMEMDRQLAMLANRQTEKESGIEGERDGGNAIQLEREESGKANKQAAE